MNNTIAPKEPTEAMLEVLLQEGPFVYRVIGNDYQICERVGPGGRNLLIHGIVTDRPDLAHEDVAKRNARWKYQELLKVMPSRQQAEIKMTVGQDSSEWGPPNKDGSIPLD